MKKSIGYMSLSLMLCLTLLFVGCGNTTRSLARNIDSTITNLIYSVSSLDWADSSTLSNISGNTESTYDSNLNFYEGYSVNETENLDNDLKERLIDKLNNIPEGDAICHGDFGPSNIILSESNIPYIIDWSHATQGNPLLDCAKTYLMLNLRVSKEIGEKYLSLYCEKHQIKKENVLEYLPIVSAIQLVRRKESEKDILLNLIKKVK